MVDCVSFGSRKVTLDFTFGIFELAIKFQISFFDLSDIKVLASIVLNPLLPVEIQEGAKVLLGQNEALPHRAVTFLVLEKDFIEVDSVHLLLR